MKAVSISNRGGRKNNEDCIRYAHSGDMWCFVLCDGLGGHQCGEVASKLVAECVCAEFEISHEVSVKKIEQYIETASEMLQNAKIEGIGGVDMATTVVVLVTDGARAVWAHIGDSRLYYIQDKEISQITDDHSVAFMKFNRGIINYDDIRACPEQNMLLRCIGTSGGAFADFSEEVSLEKGDAFLLCSDGFWELVRESDIEEAFALSSAPKEWLEKMLEVLHKNETENNDNYSAIAVII